MLPCEVEREAFPAPREVIPLDNFRADFPCDRRRPIGAVVGDDEDLRGSSDLLQAGEHSADDRLLVMRRDNDYRARSSTAAKLSLRQAADAGQQLDAKTEG